MAKIPNIIFSVVFVIFGFFLGVTYTKYKHVSVAVDGISAGKSLQNRAVARSGQKRLRDQILNAKNLSANATSATKYVKRNPKDIPKIATKALQNISSNALADRRASYDSYQTHIELTKNPFWKKNDSRVHEQRAHLKGSECRSFDENIHKSTHKYAYYFYAASSQYLCGAKVLKAQVIALDGVKADFVLSIAPNLESQKSSLEKDGWRVLPVCNLPGPNGMYAATLHKIRAFHLLQYDRVIYMDTDMSIVRSIHHVFEMPHTPLIGAWSYWDDRPTITGPFWAASPSMTLWYKLWENFHKRQNENPNDMSVINAVFGHSIPNLCVDRWGNGIRIFPQTLMLPYYYMIIDSDFEFNEPYENITEVCHMLRTVHFTKFGKPFSFQSWQSKIKAERNSHAVDRCLDDIGAQWNSVKMHVC